MEGIRNLVSAVLRSIADHCIGCPSRRGKSVLNRGGANSLLTARRWSCYAILFES